MNSRLYKLFILMLWMFWAAIATVWADEQPHSLPHSKEYAELIADYSRVQSRLESSKYNEQIAIQSKIDKGHALGQVYGVLNFTFSTVTTELRVAKNWCDIAILHLNVKSCVTNSHGKKADELSFYVGRKFYQPPEDAYEIQYVFQVKNQKHDYEHILLTAKSGPFGTEDYMIKVEAVPLTAQSTFIHFSYSYGFGFTARMALSAYLATLGRDKVGFTVTGHDEEGKPIYVDGIEGAVERNSVRYFLAIQAFLDALYLPTEKERFEARINRWFDLTQQYTQQLYEVDKDEYLVDKRKEFANQKALQEAE
jgi:hypothetical protein